MAQFSPRVRAARDYILNPDMDPIKAASALYGKHANANTYLSTVDASVRGIFTASTAIMKGTARFTGDVAKSLNKVVKPRKIIESTLSRLIGQKDTNDILNFTDNILKESTDALKEMGKQISIFTTEYAANATNMEYGGSASNVLRSMKTAMLSASGYSFSVNEMIQNTVVIDIETGGLGKNAPIVQMAMADISRIPNMSQMTPDEIRAYQEEIARLTPREQLERGMLSMQMLPEAVLRDDARTAANGAVRTPTYNMTTHLPRSAQAFQETFGGWGLHTEGYTIGDFYREYADEVDPSAADPNDPMARRISDANMASIRANLEQHGFISLQDGRRLYSQREATKWSTIFMKRAADENKNLTAANISFESFRVGKLQNFFVEDAEVGVDDRAVNFVIGRDQMTQAEKDKFFLNNDPDIVAAFGGELKGHKDIRDMYQATWKSKYKLNILDENNYYFVDQFKTLQNKGRSNEMINLFPEFMRRLGGGLKTYDQQNLTKMLFSGLMQLDYIPHSQDIFSGTAIDWATRTALGESESHLAFSDVLQQARIMTEGKLGDATSDVYNMTKATGSAAVGDQVKGMFSAIRVLLDPKRKTWFDLGKIIRETEVSVNHPIQRTTEAGQVFNAPAALGNLQFTGSIAEVNKQYNITKELLRINETVDHALGVGNTLYDQRGAGLTETMPARQLEANSPQLREGTTIEYNGTTYQTRASIQTPSGRMYQVQGSNALIPAQDITIPAQDVTWFETGHEPFSLGRQTGQKRHELTTPDSRSLYMSYTTHDYELTDRIREQHQSHLAAGATADEANAATKEWLVGQYAETRGIQSTGRTAPGMIDQFRTLMGMFNNRQEMTDTLRFQMEHGKKAMDASIHEQVRGRVAEVARLGKEDIITPTRDFVTEGARTVSDVFSGRRSLNDISLSSISNLPNAIVQQTFNVDADFARMFTRVAGRPLAVAGAVGAVAGAVGAGYMVDGPSWKATTGDILKMTGEEKTILEQGHHKSGGNLLDVSTPYLGDIQHINPNGAVLTALDSSKVDYAIGDGDTVEVLSKGFLGMGRKKLGSIRVAGIDTPETSHGGGNGPGNMPYSAQGKQYLSNVLSSREGAYVAIGPKQTYGRAVGLVVDESGINYSHQMVEQGLGSVLYRETPFEDLISQKDYNRAENRARAGNRGMWSEPFYYGAQSGIEGRDRTGWNKMTPTNAYKFNFDRSPGTTTEQVEKMREPMEMAHSLNSIIDTTQEDFLNAAGSSIGRGNHKALMADMQQMALANSMQKNRGRGRERR